MKKAVAMILVLSTFVAAAFTGCAQNDSGSKLPQSTPSAASKSSESVNLTFSWWGTQTRHDATLKVIKMYEKNHPSVTITPIYQGYDGYFKKLSMLAAANNMPDVMQFYIGSAETQQFLDKNLVEPLDGYISQKIVDTSKINDSILSNGKYNGKIYGISGGSNTLAMVVDPTYYEKAGLTVPSDGYASWENLGKDLVKLKAATGSYGADAMFDTNDNFRYFCRQRSEMYFGTKNLIGFSEKTYTDYYTIKKSWQDQGLTPPFDVSASIKDPSGSELAQNKAAIKVVPSSQFSQIQKANGHALQLIPMPGPNADKASWVQAGLHFSIAANSKNKTEAAKFLNYFINDADANKVLKGERGIPINSDVLEQVKPEFDKNLKSIGDYVAKVSKHSAPQDGAAPSASTPIFDLMKDLDQQILYSKITPAEAYKQIQNKAQEQMGNQ